MDFHSLKRKRLQSLCKKHGILANITNLQMAHFLTLSLKEKGNSILKQHCNVKNSEDEHKQIKKVCFNPDIKTREYELSGCKRLAKRRRGRRTTWTSASTKKSKKSILRDKVSNKRGIGNGKIGIASCTRRAQAEAQKEDSFVMEFEIKTDKGNENDPQLQDSLKRVSYDGEARKGARRSARIEANFDSGR